MSCGDERSRRNARQVLRRVGDAWSLVLVAQLIDGPLRFNALLRAVDGISHRMLTRTLRSPERDGLVSRTSYPETPPRVEYTLTDLGRTLVEPVLGLVACGVGVGGGPTEERTAIRWVWWGTR